MALGQQGDSAAYTDLLGQCRLILRSMLQKKVSDEALLEDLIQEILISLHKARHTYQAERSFAPWLFSIANFRLQDHFRSHYRQLNFQQRFIETLELENQGEDVTFWAQRHEEVQEAILRLPEKQGRLVDLMKLQGYTAAEVAEQTGMSVSAVKVSVHRSLKELKKQIQGADENQ